MKRTSFDERRDLQIADDFNAGNMPCTFCRATTSVQDLNTYGARCFDCYTRYCCQDRHYPTVSVVQRREMADAIKAAVAGGLRPGPREYMRAMKARQEAGERLTAGRRGFLEAARIALSSSGSGTTS